MARLRNGIRNKSRDDCHPWIIQERERQKELALIKKQYLGADKVKKKTLRPSEKFRFNFDWEASDDTSRDLNPIYNNPVEAVHTLTMMTYISSDSHRSHGRLTLYGKNIACCWNTVLQL